MNKEVRRKVYHLEPIVTEKTVWNEGNFTWAVIIGIFVILFELFAVLFLGLVRPYAIFLGFLLIILYSIALFFLLEPRVVKEIKRTEVMTLERERPVIKEIVKEVPKHVEKVVEKPVTKTVYLPTPKKPRKPPKRYKYVASDQTKVYHFASSRLARLIRPKNRVYSDDVEELKKQGYRPAKHVIEKLKGERKKKALSEYKKRKSKKSK